MMMVCWGIENEDGPEAKGYLDVNNVNEEGDNAFSMFIKSCAAANERRADGVPPIRPTDDEVQEVVEIFINRSVDRNAQNQEGVSAKHRLAAFAKRSGCPFVRDEPGTGTDAVSKNRPPQA